MREKGIPTNGIKSSLLLVPRIVHLLYCLVKDPRVPFKKKAMLAGGLFYFLLPFDLVPESSMPHLGLVDDVIVLIRVLRKMLVDTDPGIIDQHWRGTYRELEWVKHVIKRGDDAIINTWNKVLGNDAQLKTVKT